MTPLGVGAAMPLLKRPAALPAAKKPAAVGGAARLPDLPTWAQLAAGRARRVQGGADNVLHARQQLHPPARHRAHVERHALHEADHGNL
eukprot:473413-Pyramimonas_sp.AAC.1